MNAGLFHWLHTLSPDLIESDHGIRIEGLCLYYLQVTYFTYPTQIEKGTIVLWEDIWLRKTDLVKARLLSLLNRNKSIPARDTTVVSLDKPMLDTFLNANHLMGSPKVKYKYGLHYKGVLVAAASFSSIKTYYREDGPCQSAELVRYASLSGVNIVGGLSKLLEHFIQEHKPDDIMTYADREWSDGSVYETLGFQLVEQTPPQEFWIHLKEMVRYSARRLPESLLSGKEEGKPTETFLREQGYFLIHNAGNFKYLLTLS